MEGRTTASIFGGASEASHIVYTRPWISGTNGLVARTLTEKPCRADEMEKAQFGDSAKDWRSSQSSEAIPDPR